MELMKLLSLQKTQLIEAQADTKTSPSAKTNPRVLNALGREQIIDGLLALNPVSFVYRSLCH
jgi:hypothetical protein